MNHTDSSKVSQRVLSAYRLNNLLQRAICPSKCEMFAQKRRRVDAVTLRYHALRVHARFLGIVL